MRYGEVLKDAATKVGMHGDSLDKKSEIRIFSPHYRVELALERQKGFQCSFNKLIKSVVYLERV
jgi:hypothetical protein